MNHSITFEVSSEATAGILSFWNSTLDLLDLNCSISAQCNGPGGGFSSESLFAISALNNIIEIFKTECDKHKVHFERIEGRAILSIVKNHEIDHFLIKEIEFYIKVEKPTNKEKAKSLLDRAIKISPICNNIKAGKIFHINI